MASVNKTKPKSSYTTNREPKKAKQGRQTPNARAPIKHVQFNNTRTIGIDELIMPKSKPFQSNTTNIEIIPTERQGSKHYKQQHLPVYACRYSTSGPFARGRLGLAWCRTHTPSPARDGSRRCSRLPLPWAWNSASRRFEVTIRGALEGRGGCYKRSTRGCVGGCVYISLHSSLGCCVVRRTFPAVWERQEESA